jgi:hypothetical protein
MKSIRTLAAIALAATTALVLVTGAAADAPLRGLTWRANARSKG